METESSLSRHNREEIVVHFLGDNQVEKENEAFLFKSVGAKKQTNLAFNVVSVISLVTLVCACALLSYWAITYDWSQTRTQGRPHTFSIFPASSPSTFSSSITTSQSSIFSTSIPTDNKVPTNTEVPTVSEPAVIFVKGIFNFSQAKQACAGRGRGLARQGDMNRAFEQGYERCKYGWLLERQLGYVMQAPNPRCGGGRLGLILSSLKSTHVIAHGAYCGMKGIKDTASNLLQASPSSGKSVNWWVSYYPSDLYDLKRLLRNKRLGSWTDKKQLGPAKEASGSSNLMGAIRVIYLCCRIFSVEASPHKNSTFIRQRITTDDIADLVSSYKREFGNPDIKVFAQVTGSYTAMMTLGGATRNRSNTIRHLVDKAAKSGLNGIVFDYEPKQNYSRDHAEAYREFLDHLVDHLRIYSMEGATVVAEWGILKYFDIYARSKCSIIGSMSNTYFGSNISRNFQSVDVMMKSINSSRLQIGVATERKHRLSAWTESKLRSFLEGLSRRGVESLHLYSGKWKGFKHIKKYFLNSLIEFVEKT